MGRVKHKDLDREVQRRYTEHFNRAWQREWKEMAALHVPSWTATTSPDLTGQDPRIYRLTRSEGIRTVLYHGEDPEDLMGAAQLEDQRWSSSPR